MDLNKSDFNGIYFNGISSLPLKVRVSIDAFHFKLYNEEDTLIATWDHGGVNSIQELHKKIVVKYGHASPFQSLELEGDNIVKELFVIKPDAHYLKDPYIFFKRKGVKAIVVAILGVALFVVAFYMFGIPAVINVVAEVFPKDSEVELGQSLKSSLLAGDSIDVRRTEQINRFYKQLKVNTEYDINITVVHSNIQNAFALPGGEIVVFSAILDSMKTPEELVALLGHETGHIENRHTLKALMKNVSNYIIVSLVFQDYSGIMAVIAENAATLDQLSYSRAAETESDDFGFITMVENRQNPDGMVRLFSNLEKEGHGEDVPQMLLTHPSLDLRIDRVKQKIAALEHSAFVQNDSLEHYFVLLKLDRSTREAD